MAAVPPKFQVEEEVSLAGRMLRIAGLVQYDLGDDNVVTRYSLVDPTGAAVILQQEGGNFSMLRPFPPAAAPTAEGSSVSVMGEKYNLAGVRKMKMLGASGKPPAESPQAPLSGCLNKEKHRSCGSCNISPQTGRSCAALLQ